MFVVILYWTHETMNIAEARPIMTSIWDTFIPQRYDFCDSDITRIVYPSENGGVFELHFDVLPFDEQDRPLPVLPRRFLAREAYVFDRPHDEFVVNQTIKSVDCYPEIIRIDIGTTGSLLRLECKSYRIEG